MPRMFDAIIVGSGFGGAVAACRLAESGARVLVLERGRRWSPGTYPRTPGDPWLFDADRPRAKNGWLDVRLFRRMAVVQGAGVGGGSLCYSSVVTEAAPEAFGCGWPAEVNYEALRPYYRRVAEMLAVRTLPAGQRTPRGALLEEAARAAGYAGRVVDAPLAVSFDPSWHYGLPEPLHGRHSRAFRNPHGRWQGTCVHLGNCDIGCDVRAKNTLDVNYLAAAERSGADVRPLHLVRRIEPAAGGYRVSFDRPDAARRGAAEAAVAAKVVLAAGSLGSTELLLRCRDAFGCLPNVGAALGAHWSPNANVLSPAVYRDPARVRQSIGPTITALLDAANDGESGHRFVVEDDGFPNVLLHALQQRGPVASVVRHALGVRPASGRRTDEWNPLAGVMVWLGAGVDAADGVLRLRRDPLRPWRRRLALRWDPAGSREVVERIISVHRRLTEASGGRFYVPPYWSWFRALVTVHPLGGCRMGRDRTEGVVDHRGEVFGYPNLFVADGAIVPRPIGRNPSMTIAALSERIADHLAEG